MLSACTGIQESRQTLKKVRAWGCWRFISLKAGPSTRCARYLRALATDFLLDDLFNGAFLGFASCSRNQQSSRCHLQTILHGSLLSSAVRLQAERI